MTFSQKPGVLFSVVVSTGVLLTQIPQIAVAQPSVGLKMTSEKSVINEGESGLKITLTRMDAVKPDAFSIIFSGTAKIAHDYQVGTDGFFSGNSLDLQMMPGEFTTYFIINAKSDGIAEDSESITMQLLSARNSFEVSDETSIELSIPANDFSVVSLADEGEGSLRQAILNANAIPGHDVIKFDSDQGPFGPPQVIELESALPQFTDAVTVDGYVKGFLWKPAGVTISGNNTFRIFKISKGTEASITSLTLSDGYAENGGAIENEGNLLVEGVTFMNNSAEESGGAISNRDGEVLLVNSTLVGNSAGKGGAVSNENGMLTVTQVTFHENEADSGGALFNSGELLLRNSILANSKSTADCVSEGSNHPSSTHNIVEQNKDCPGVKFESDPKFERMAYFNGMTQTIALGMHSLAINTGDNASAVDQKGQALVWDQRGNGDPRIVAGYVDMGAFETQAFPKLIVDTAEDIPQMACGGVRGDCPLRAALKLVEVSDRFDTITFDEVVFAENKLLTVDSPLPVPTKEITVDASAVGGVKVNNSQGGAVFESDIPDNLKLLKVVPTE